MKNFLTVLAIFTSASVYANSGTPYECVLKKHDSGQEFKKFRLSAFDSVVAFTFIDSNVNRAAVISMIEVFSMSNSTQKTILLSLQLGQSLEAHVIQSKDEGVLSVVRALDSSGLSSGQFHEISSAVNVQPKQMSLELDGYGVTCNRLED